MDVAMGNSAPHVNHVLFCRQKSAADDAEQKCSPTPPPTYSLQLAHRLLPLSIDTNIHTATIRFSS